MPRTCRHQARLSTRKPVLRAAAKAQSPSPARHFDVGGGLGASPAAEVVDFTQRPTRPVALQAERRRSFREAPPPHWEEAQRQMRRYLGKETPESSSDEDLEANYGPPSAAEDLARLSKIKSAVLKAKSKEEVEEIKAALKTGAEWRKVAPWIRRSPTLAEYRREEEGKPSVDWVALAGFRQTSEVTEEPPPQPPKARPKKAKSPSPKPPRDPPPPTDAGAESDDSGADDRLPSSVVLRGAQRALRQKGARFGEELPQLRPELPPRGLQSSHLGLDRAMESATGSMIRNSWSLPQLQSHLQKEAAPQRMFADLAPKPSVDPEPLRYAPTLIRRRVRGRGLKA